MNNVDVFKSLKNIVLVIFLLTGSLVIHGCGGGSSENTNMDTVNAQEMGFEKAIDKTGGVLEVTNLESQAFGAKIIVLPDALTEEKILSISTGTTYFETPANYTPAGKQINLGPDGIHFEKPIYISIPYSDIDNDGFIDGTGISEHEVQLIYFNEESGIWENIEIGNINLLNNTVEAQTDHFSTYLVAINEEVVNATDDDPTVFMSGEYFVGSPEFTIIDAEQDINAYDNRELVTVGCIGQDFSQCTTINRCIKCATPYVLTIAIKNNILTAVIDRYTTTNAGISVTFDESGESVTFDPTEIFKKVGQSESAALWDWRCDFIPEHTHIQNYNVCSLNNTDAICNDNAEQFFSSIEVIDANTVRINFAVDISDESNADGEPIANIYFNSGDRIAIEFEANYL